jgi:hypothetical protein
MACDSWGEGRMVEPDQIHEAIAALFGSDHEKKKQKKQKKTKKLKSRKER